MVERDTVDGPAYHQNWLGISPTMPIISGGRHALCLSGCQLS